MKVLIDGVEVKSDEDNDNRDVSYEKSREQVDRFFFSSSCFLCSDAMECESPSRSLRLARHLRLPLTDRHRFTHHYDPKSSSSLSQSSNEPHHHAHFRTRHEISPLALIGQADFVSNGMLGE